ncbi:hypothetical protein RFI_33995, partial [Reticulomyxa filosa]
NDETDATQFIMKLKEGQLGNVFQCLINGLFDEKEEEYNRKNCAQLLGKLSMKWNEQQLNEAFNFSMDIFTDKNNNTEVRGGCVELLGTVTVNLSGRHFDTFKCLISGLKDSDSSVRK